MTALSVEERQELAQSIRAACERLSPEERVRAVAYDGDSQHRGFDTELWKVLCQQVGVTAIALPERFGGAGYGASAMGVVAHEFGRALAPVPFVATVLATNLLLAADAGDRLAGLVDGERTVAVALTGDGGLWRREDVTVSAENGATGWTLNGVVRHVLHGASADDLVVAAVAGGELALFTLDAAGAAVAEEEVLDGTRPMATLTFNSTPATLLARGGAVEEAIADSVDLALAVLSAEQVGACERVLEIATDYARTREQFNRPIGSFQAIKHKCADMLLEVESAKSAAYYAGWCAAELNDELPSVASLAKAYCSEAYFHCAAENIQIHGGIGFTWEHPAHLYFKRAKSSELLFGDPAYHRELLAQRIGL